MKCFLICIAMAPTNLGGLDIFVAYPKGKDWTNPQNLGYPLNSPKDDFGFCLNDDHKTGYLSSNRSGSVDEIYTFKSHPPTFYVKGIVTNAETGEPIPGVSVEAVTRAGKFIEQVPTNSMGKFQLKLPVDQLFDLKAGKEGFFEVSDTLSTEGLQYSDIFFKDFALTAIVIDKPIVLENIYYDLDKWAIREDAKPSLNKLAKILEDNPGIVIELSSHTDSRASNDYNQVLSYKRATSAVEYIYSRGIRRGRITARGYGETRLVNRCSDNVNCSEEEHQQNRRTEFKVVRIEGLTQ